MESLRNRARVCARLGSASRAERFVSLAKSRENGQTNRIEQRGPTTEKNLETSIFTRRLEIVGLMKGGTRSPVRCSSHESRFERGLATSRDPP